MFGLPPHSPVLVVAAHHDDEVLGCGGTIARLTAEGCPVFVGILGQGALSRLPEDDHQAREALTRKMDGQFHEASSILGFTCLEPGGFPDNGFDTVPLLDVVRRVEVWCDAVRPGLILTHYAGDLNVDHQITSRAAQTAARPLPGSSVRALLSFEVPSSTEWAHQRSGMFQPDSFVDISSHLNAKFKALACYEDELRPFPHPRSEQAVRHLAGWRGASAGMEAAEAFAVIRWLHP